MLVVNFRLHLFNTFILSGSC